VSDADRRETAEAGINAAAAGMPDERLGTEEVARRLGVKRETVYAYVSRGLLERHPASGPHDSRFDPAEVERLVARARRPDRSSALEVVVETELTLLDPAGRLSYRGRDAIELARFRSFEEVVSLLWDGAPAAPWVLDDERAEAVAAVNDALGPEAPDAERIAAVVATLAARDPSRDDRNPDSVRRAGAEVFAGILTALDRGRPALTTTERGRPALSIGSLRSTAAARGERRSTAGVAERLWVALADSDAKPRAEEVAGLNAALVLLADHELAASTFAARVAASAWAGPYRVILAGLGPLGGSLHGGAGLAVEALLDEVTAGADPGAALDALIAAGPVPGFGHRVYRDRDPRADHLLARLGRDPATAALLAAAETRGLPAPNVDFALGAGQGARVASRIVGDDLRRGADRGDRRARARGVRAPAAVSAARLLRRSDAAGSIRAGGLNADQAAGLGDRRGIVLAEQREQRGPAFEGVDRLAQQRRAALGFAPVDEAERRPEAQLERLRRKFPRLDVPGRGAVHVPGGDEVVAFARDLVGSVHRDQPAQLDQRLGVILDPHLDHPFPGLAARGDDEDRRRLAPAQVAARRLARVERLE
jgi:citrate synthase